MTYGGRNWSESTKYVNFDKNNYGANFYDSSLT